jgi:hypothetical protein
VRSVFAFTLVISLSGVGSAFAAAQPPAKPASVSGSTANAAGAPLANTVVRLRAADNGSIAASTTSNGAGQFAFSVSEPGDYIIEVVNAKGEIIGSSPVMNVTAGATISGITVRSAATIPAKTSKTFFSSSTGLITAAATAAGLVGVTVAATRGSASPSK